MDQMRVYIYTYSWGPCIIQYVYYNLYKMGINCSTSY